MRKIKEYEDQIEETRFMLAAIKIQYAIFKIMVIWQKKGLVGKAMGFEQIKTFIPNRIICLINQKCERMIRIVETVRLRLLRNSFVRVKYLNPGYLEYLRLGRGNQQNEKQSQYKKNQIGFKRRRIKQLKVVQRSQKTAKESAKNKEIQVLNKAIFDIEQIYNQLIQRISQ